MPTFNATIIEGGEAELLAAVLSKVTRYHPATTPIEADLILAPPQGLTPGVASVVPVSDTQIRVNFSKPALNNAALSSVGSYQITPSRTIHSVTPEVITEPTYVILTIDEQKTGETYDLELIRIEAAP